MHRIFKLNTKNQLRYLFKRNGDKSDNCKYVVFRIDKNTQSSAIGEYSEEEAALSKLKTLEYHSQKLAMGTKYKIEKIQFPKFF